MAEVKPSVTLVTATPDAERHIELCGRGAYGSSPAPSVEGMYQWIAARIANYEEDILEHAVATFHVVCSRVVSHELVRHRLVSFTQRSQRFSESAVGDWVNPHSGLLHEACFDNDMKGAVQNYQNYRTDVSRQVARYLLPEATATSLYMTANFRELRHIIRLRMAKQAQPEMRTIARQLHNICVENWPGCFGDLEGELRGKGWL